MPVRFNLQFNALSFLLGINIIVFLIALAFQFLIPNFNGDNSEIYLSQLFGILGGMSYYGISFGRIWTIVTANFLHIDILHFALNMFSLYSIGQHVYNFYGGKKLFSTYILGGIAGMLLTLFIDFFLGTTTATLGASGSIFALAGLLLGGTIRKKRFGSELPFNFVEIFPLVLVSLLYGFIPGTGINNFAHIGGLITGIILGLIFKNDLGDHQNRVDLGVENSTYYFSVFAFTISYILLIITSISLIVS